MYRYDIIVVFYFRLFEVYMSNMKYLGENVDQKNPNKSAQTRKQ